MKIELTADERNNVQEYLDTRFNCADLNEHITNQFVLEEDSIVITYHEGTRAGDFHGFDDGWDVKEVRVPIDEFLEIIKISNEKRNKQQILFYVERELDNDQLSFLEEYGRIEWNDYMNTIGHYIECMLEEIGLMLEDENT